MTLFYCTIDIQHNTFLIQVKAVSHAEASKQATNQPTVTTSHSRHKPNTKKQQTLIHTYTHTNTHCQVWFGFSFVLFFLAIIVNPTLCLRWKEGVVLYLFFYLFIYFISFIYIYLSISVALLIIITIFYRIHTLVKAYILFIIYRLQRCCFRFIKTS